MGNPKGADMKPPRVSTPLEAFILWASMKQTNGPIKSISMSSRKGGSR
jgi:hypothetical protein